MANYPNSIVSFTTKTNGQTIQPGHVNDLQDEVTAVETQLLTWTNYAPTWTSGGVAVTVGNGTLVGKYMIVGSNCFFKILAQYGTTTSDPNPGNSWVFGLPVSALLDGVQKALGVGYVEDSGAVAYGGWAPILTSATTFVLYSPGTAATASVAITNANPFTFGNSDAVYISGSFQKA